MLVSVIIPCFNVEDYISECIESVISQTHQELEIICVDNNSTDHTWSILLELKNKHPKIAVAQEIKKGANAARNKGLSIANGNWIQFLDADDLLSPQKIEHQVSLLNNQTHVAFIAAAFKNVFLNGNIKEVIDINNNAYLAPFINQCGITSSNLWNKNAMLSVNGWNENLQSSQETDLMLRLILKKYVFIKDPNPFTLIRERASGQISQRNPEKKWQQYIDIRLDYLDKLEKLNPNELSKIKNTCFDFLMVSILTLYKSNPHLAVNCYNTKIKKEWVSNYTYGFSKMKILLIKILGLKLSTILFK